MGFIGQKIENEVGKLISCCVGGSNKYKQQGGGRLIDKIGSSYLPFEKAGFIKSQK